MHCKDIKIDYKNYKIAKFIPILIVGDNLGLNGILGFTESFADTYFCRFCKLTKSFTKIMAMTPAMFLRTPENYDSDVLSNNFPATGIRENSPFNNLLNFHAAENPSVDIMHDVLEGVIHFDVAKILNQFIYDVDKKITLETLNFRLQSIQDGPNKKLITMVSQKMIKDMKFKFSASEALLFVRILSIAINDLVTPDCLEWKLYIILRKIISIILKKEVHKGLGKILNELIEEHHATYLTLYKQLGKCKFHLMTHYEMCMNLVGSLVSLWSMRYEGKHQIFNRISNVNRCKKNLVHTLAFKHQLKMANLFLNRDCSLEIFVSNENIELTKSEFIDQYKVEIECDSISVSEHAIFRGHTLKTGAVITYGDEIVGIPIFGTIKCVFSNVNSYFVCLQRLETDFDEHFFAYTAKEIESNLIINLENITNFQTSYLTCNATGVKMFIWD
jgi:hypothetical protein